MGENFVDLSQCTKIYRKGKEEINWRNSIGAIIPFSYNGNKGKFEITEYIKEASQVVVKYNEDYYTLYFRSIKNCQLGKLFKKTHMYDVGEIINNKKVLEQKYIVTQKNGWTCRNKYYKILCLKCNKESIVREDKLTKCENCVHCIFNKPLLCDSRPDLKPYFQEKDLEYYYTKTLGCGIKLFFICPKCHRIKDTPTKIIDLVRGNFSCPHCSDKISMGEKYILSLLTQLEIEYDYQYSFKDNDIKFSETSYIPVYDFVLHGLNLIIEIDGIQHQAEREHFKNRFNLTQQELDLLKNELAQKLGYKIIRINYVSYKYTQFKQEIIKKLSPVLNLSNVDFDLCKKESLKSYVLMSIELWNKGLSIGKIAKDIKIHPITVRKYLKIGNDLNLCDYDFDESAHRGAIQSDLERKKVVCLETNQLFNSVSECSSESEMILGVHIPKSIIYQQIAGRQKTAKGYHFKYYEENIA